MQNVEFAILPPEFICSSAQAQVAIYDKKYFPSIPHHLKNVGNYALASVVYHRHMLICDLPPNELETMRESVRCTVPGINVSDVRVTGVL